MSYSIQDRYGGIVSSYHPPAHGRTAAGARTWWPDYGPGTHDFSQAVNSHPTEIIFEQVVKGKPKHPPASHLQAKAAAAAASQFRRPAPAREALFKTAQPAIETKFAAHEFTERRASLRRMELRQNKIDSWSQDREDKTLGKIKDPSGASRSAIAAGRGIYEKHGFLVGKSSSSGSLGGGSNSLSRPALPLSLSTMLLRGDRSLREDSSDRPKKLKNYSKSWKVCPESSYVFDPSTFLPARRGGYQTPTRWPDTDPAGNREFVAPPALTDASP